MTKLNDYWLRTFYLLLSSLQYTPTRDMYFGIFVKTALRVFSNNNVTCIVLWISRSSCIFLDACSVCLQPSVNVVQIGKKTSNKYVGPPYCRAEVYAGRVSCAPSWVTVSMSTGQTDRRTDVRPLHYAFRWTRIRNHSNSVPAALTLASCFLYTVWPASQSRAQDIPCPS